MSCARGEQVAKGGARGDRGKLVRIAEDDEPRVPVQRAHQPLHQGQIKHRAFVDEHHAGGQGIVAMVQKGSALRRIAEQAMDGGGIETGVAQGFVVGRRIGDVRAAKSRRLRACEMPRGPWAPTARFLPVRYPDAREP